MFVVVDVSFVVVFVFDEVDLLLFPLDGFEDEELDVVLFLDEYGQTPFVCK